jgi:hypothetical protein
LSGYDGAPFIAFLVASLGGPAFGLLSRLGNAARPAALLLHCDRRVDIIVAMTKDAVTSGCANM